MAGGIRYRDTRTVLYADQPSVSLTGGFTTVIPRALTAIPANYWHPEKLLKVTAAFKVETGAEIAYLQWGLGLGAVDTGYPQLYNAELTPLLKTIASKTGTVVIQGFIQCWTRGTAGTFAVSGKLWPDADWANSTYPNGGGGPRLLDSALSHPAAQTFDTTAAGQSIVVTMNRGTFVEAGTITVTCTGAIIEVL